MYDLNICCRLLKGSAVYYYYKRLAKAFYEVDSFLVKIFYLEGKYIFLEIPEKK